MVDVCKEIAFSRNNGADKTHGLTGIMPACQRLAKVQGRKCQSGKGTGNEVRPLTRVFELIAA